MQENTVNKRPSRLQYYIKGLISILVHTFTFLFVCFCKLLVFSLSERLHSYFFLIATLHQPKKNLDNWNFWNVISLGQDLLFSWKNYIDPTTIGNYLSTKMQVYRNLAGCFFVTDDTNCSWNINDNIIFIVLINLISITAIDWQYAIKPVLFEKVKHFEVYKVSKKI